MKTMFIILCILLSVFVLAEEKDIEFNVSGFVKEEGANMTFAKLLGAIVLAFLLISAVVLVVKDKKKKS